MFRLIKELYDEGTSDVSQFAFVTVLFIVPLALLLLVVGIANL